MKLPHEILKDMREDRDIKQQTIADLIGTTQQQYSKYETGESELPLRAFMILADYYDVSADFLLGRKGDYYNVPGLAKKVLKDTTAAEVLEDIQSLSIAGRTFVVECIGLRKLKETCTCASRE